MIISSDIVQVITNYTNKRIQWIDYSSIKNVKYRHQRQRQVKNPLTVEELYAFIGLFRLIGITKKTHLALDELWSVKSIHYLPIAAAAMTRERFQLIAKNITFDDTGKHDSMFFSLIIYEF